MQQVFFNLLMNAQQAIGAGGEIRITTSWEEETGCEQVVVWDNGAGIPLHLLTKIFDPFFSTKAPGEGTGLGLSVSYGIVKDHGGDIQVKSEPGQGTQFTILLPGSAP
jgi:signal transduction histidine kinase